MTEATAARDPARTGALPAARLFLLAGLAALGSLATNIILPAFPQIGADLGGSGRELALTLSSFFIAFAVGQLLVGPLSDRFGRRLIVLGGLATFAVGSLMCATATNFEVLLAGRVVQALGACAAAVVSRAIARDLFEGEALARVLALIMVAMATSPGFSPLLGSVLGDAFGWPAIFLCVAAFGGVLAWLYAANLGETHPASSRTPFNIAAVTGAYARLARDARFIYPALAVSLVIGALYTFFATAPSVLINELHLTSLQLALYFAATVIIVFAAGFAAPRLARRLGHPVIAATGIGFAVAGGMVMLATSATPALWSLTLGLSLFLFGMGMANPLGTALTLQPFAREAGIASALLGFLQMSCAALGSSLASVLPMPPTAALAAVMTVASAMALAVFVPVVRPKTAETASS